MKNTKKLVIFDLDGTVLDSVKDLTVNANKVRQKYNLEPLQKSEILNCIGDGVDVFVKKLFYDVEKVPEKAFEEFNIFYFESIADYTIPFEGIIEVLCYLKEKNITTGILSNKSEFLTKKVLSLLKMDKYFKFIYGGDSFIEKKPSPLPIINILKNFSFQPNETAIVGDSFNDINAGKSANIYTIAALYGYTNKNILINCKPDCSIEKALDLKNIL